MKKEDNRLEKSEAFDWKAEIISWIKIIIAAAVIAFVPVSYTHLNARARTASDHILISLQSNQFSCYRPSVVFALGFIQAIS